MLFIYLFIIESIFMSKNNENMFSS